MFKIKGVMISSCYGNGVKQELYTIEDDEDDDNDDDEEVVSAVRKSMEERRRLKVMYMPYDFSWKFPPATEKLFMTMGEVQDADEIIIPVTPDVEECAAQEERSAEDNDDDDDDFHSAASFLSDPLSSNGTIASLIKSFTECHRLESDGKQLLLIQELIDCEGWPFGLIRKVIQLPPLPSSPSESWSWAKAPIRARISANKMKRETDKYCSSSLPLAS